MTSCDVPQRRAMMGRQLSLEDQLASPVPRPRLLGGDGRRRLPLGDFRETKPTTDGCELANGVILREDLDACFEPTTRRSRHSHPRGPH